MKYEETLFINPGKLGNYSKLLSTAPRDRSEAFGEDSTITNTVKFSDGKLADIKICGVQFDEDEPENSRPYAEAVLFNENGCELACTDVDEEYDGEWIIPYGDDEYVVTVVPYTDFASRLELKRKLVEEASIAEVEDFLGYPVTGNRLDPSQLWNRVSDTAAQIPEEALKKYEEKYLFVA